MVKEYERKGGDSGKKGINEKKKRGSNENNKDIIPR
jgi:hypothetical protein